MKHHSGMFQKGYDPRRFDLTAISKARKGTRLSKEQCRRMSEGEQDKERRQMYRDIMEWLTTNIVEPELFEDGTNADKVNIWFMIMNYGNTFKENLENDDRVVRFISYILNYLPEEFRDREMYKRRIRDEEIVATFERWFGACKQKLQNYLAKEYFAKGRMKDLEILKRRYKENWSESKVVDLTADANMKVDKDSKLEIKIVDA